MGTQRTTVVVNVEGEQQATAAARRLENMADRVQGKAERARRAVQDAERQSRLHTLMEAARARGTVLRAGFNRYSPVSVGAGGLGLRRPGFAAVAGLYIGDRFAEGFANLMIEAEQNDVSMGALLGREARELLTNWPGMKAARLAFMLLNRKMGAARSAAVFDTATNLGLTHFTGEKSSIDQEIAGIGAAQRQRWAQMRQLEAAEEKRRQAIDAQAVEIRSKLDELEAESLRGLKAHRYPVQLPEAVWRLAENLRRGAVESRRREAEDKLNQRLKELIDGDGD